MKHIEERLAFYNEVLKYAKHTKRVNRAKRNIEFYKRMAKMMEGR